MKMTVNLDKRGVLNNSEGDSSFIIVFNTRILKKRYMNTNTSPYSQPCFEQCKASPVYIGLVVTFYTNQDLYITPTPQESQSLRDAQQVFSTSRSFSEPVSRLSSSIFV